MEAVVIELELDARRLRKPHAGVAPWLPIVIEHHRETFVMIGHAPHVPTVAPSPMELTGTLIAGVESEAAGCAVNVDEFA